MLLRPVCLCNATPRERVTGMVSDTAAATTTAAAEAMRSVPATASSTVVPTWLPQVAPSRAYQ